MLKTLLTRYALAASLAASSVVTAPEEAEAARISMGACTKDRYRIAVFLDIPYKNKSVVEKGMKEVAARYDRHIFESIRTQTMPKKKQDQIFAEWVAASDGKLKLENYRGILVNRIQGKFCPR